MQILIRILQALSIGLWLLAAGMLVVRLLRLKKEDMHFEPPHKVKGSWILAVSIMGLFSRLLVLVIPYVIGRQNGWVYEPFLDAWTHWDARHYIALAEEGYQTVGVDRYRIVFFPLYPMLLRGMMLLIPNGKLAGIVLSCLCFGGASGLLYGWIGADGNRGVALRACVLLWVNPFSFFFCAAFSESLFLLLSMGVAFAVRRGRFGLASCIGMLAALTRLMGVALMGYIFLEAILQGGGWKRVLKRCALSLWVALGFVGYLGLNAYLFGDPFIFMAFEKENWHQSFGLFWNTIEYTTAYLVANDTDVRYGVWLPQLASIFITGGLMVYQVHKKRLSRLAYSFVYWWITISPTWLLSGPRYLMNMFPNYLDGAALLRKKGIYAAVMILSSCLLLAYTILYLQEGMIM